MAKEIIIWLVHWTWPTPQKYFKLVCSELDDNPVLSGTVEYWSQPSGAMCDKGVQERSSSQLAVIQAGPEGLLWSTNRSAHTRTWGCSGICYGWCWLLNMSADLLTGDPWGNGMHQSQSQSPSPNSCYWLDQSLYIKGGRWNCTDVLERHARNM